MNNLSIEQRARIFQAAPEGYDWAAMDESYLWCAYENCPRIDLTSSTWCGHCVPLIGLDGFKVYWQQSLVTRPTDEELETLKK